MLNKVQTVAILMNGGISESDLLKLPNVRRKHIDEAKNLLQQAFSGFDREMDEYIQSIKRRMTSKTES